MSLRFAQDALELEVCGPPAPHADVGAVLAAARERAALHGGTVDVRTDDPELRFAPGAILRAKASDHGEHNYVVTAVRPHGNRLLLRLEGVDNVTTAGDPSTFTHVAPTILP